MGERIKMEIFKVGRYPQRIYTKEDLMKIAESYSPEYFQALQL